MRLILIFALLVFCVPVYAQKAQSFHITPLPGQPSPPTLKLNPSLISTIRKDRTNLRRLFYLTLSMRRAGRAQELLLVYRNILQDTPNDRFLRAVYPLVHLAAMVFLPFDQIPQDREKVRMYFADNFFQTEAKKLREESVVNFPQNPEVFLMAAEYEKDQRHIQKAIELTEKALRLDNQWGFAHNLLGACLVEESDGLKNQATIKQNALIALKEFAIAERLEPTASSRNFYLNRAFAYNQLKQYQKAATCMDQVIRKSEQEHESQRALQQWYLIRKGFLDAARKAAQLTPAL